ncbi:MAG TPA: hypothetical protein VE981_21760 [Planctomycetota bacterium]|nr:hypothetical protein [Planctomycetota bacterium]
MLLLLASLTGLLGCDVALVAYFASKGGSKSKSSSSAPAPNVSFNLWVAELGAITGATEQTTLRTNHGDPDVKWTLLSSGTSSGEFTMPTPTAGGFDAILIQATDAQIYEIDSFEIIDATGTTIQTAGATTTFCSADIVPGPGTGSLLDSQGPPDGKGAVTAAIATDRSFVFMKRATPITTFRINLWRQNLARLSGDVEWTQTISRANDQKAGGAAVNSVGTIYLSFRDGSSFFMTRYDSSGNTVGTLGLLEGTVPAVGSASIAIDRSTDDVFVATTYDPGSNIRLYRFVGTSNTPAFGPVDSIATGGTDLVEVNSLSLNSDRDLIVAGAADFGGLNGVGHFLRKHNKLDLTNMWSLTTPPAAPLDTTTNPRPTYWYCSATDLDTSGNRQIFTSGDLNSLLGLGNEDAYTAKTIDNATSGNPTGAVTELWNSKVQGSGTRPARGQAIGVDGNHNVYVAGFCTGTGATGLDSFIVHYDGLAAPTPAAVDFFTLTRSGNDELLDIAVELDGTVYATGYETNGAQGEDLVLYKIAANKAIIWKRTLNFNNLADRGVKVIATPTHVMVVGQVGVAAGNLDIHVRKYVK